MIYLALCGLMLVISLTGMGICQKLDRIARAIEAAHGITGEQK